MVAILEFKGVEDSYEVAKGYFTYNSTGLYCNLVCRVRTGGSCANSRRDDCSKSYTDYSLDYSNPHTITD